MCIKDILILSLAISSGLAPVSAQRPADKKAPTDSELLASLPVQVGVFVEFISADRKLIEALLYEHREDTNDRALRAKLHEHLGKGTATVSEMGYVVTRSGAQASVESVVELIYPTEFDPAETSQKLEGPITKENRVATAATPTAFETRNTGLTIKVTPQVGPGGKVVDMQIRVSGVEHAGDDVHGQGLAMVTMPKFFSRAFSTSVSATSGEDVLLGASKPNEESTLRELVFVRPTVLRTTTIDDARKRWEASQAEAADHDLSYVRNVVTLVEYLEVPLSELHSRMRQPLLSADATALRRAFDPLIESDKVKRTSVSYVPTKSAQRTSSRSGNERIYGVEADPPEMPQNVQGPLEPGVEVITPAHYTTFEMRPEGLKVELDPQLGPDGETIDVSMAVERVQHAGLTRYGQRESEMALPLFHTERVATNVTTLAGNYFLLGMHSKRAHSGQNLGTYTLVFATCSLKSP